MNVIYYVSILFTMYFEGVHVDDFGDYDKIYHVRYFFKIFTYILRVLLSCPVA